MSQDGRTYANTPYTTLRVPPREDRPPRTYEVDPAAVARLKAHLQKQQEETMPRPKKVSEAAATPAGWGIIEKDAGSPDRAHLGEYRAVIESVCAEASREWARILAPSPHKADRLRDLLKEEGTLEVQRKTLKNEHYVYFRLAPMDPERRP